MAKSRKNNWIAPLGIGLLVFFLLKRKSGSTDTTGDDQPQLPNNSLPQLLKPTNLQAIQGKVSGILFLRLKCDPLPGAIGYDFEYRKDGGTWERKTVTAPDATGIMPQRSTLYEWRVRAIMQTGQTTDYSYGEPLFTLA